jgi:hypothetical protein
MAVTFTPILPEAATQDPALLRGDEQGSAPRRPHRHLEFHGQITIVLDQITLIDYDDKVNALVVVER